MKTTANDMKGQGPTGDSDPTRRIVEAIQEHGKLLGERLESYNENTRNLTKSLFYLNCIVILLAIVQLCTYLITSHLSISSPFEVATAIFYSAILVMLFVFVPRLWKMGWTSLKNTEGASAKPDRLNKKQ